MGNDQLTAVYCDDRASSRELVEAVFPRIFPKWKATIYIGENGNDLVSLVKAHSPQIILTDNNMPNRNGSDALREIRRLGINTPALMLTGLLNEARTECAGIERMSYLEKPYTSEELIKKVREVYPEYN